MSDRSFSAVVLPLARPWGKGAAVRGVARSISAAPGAGWSGLPDMRGVPGPDVPPRASFWATFRAAWRRQRTRRCLADLDAHTLKDIGISYAEAEVEINKPFWLV